jgi:1,4-dihydroxy-2-naphthoate octaprenyltransferase
MSNADSPALHQRLSSVLTDTRGVPRERASFLTQLKYTAVIRRFEFLPVILTVAFMPAVLGANSWDELGSLNAVLAVLWAVLGMQIGNMTNALADRELDAAGGKSRMPDAIYGLGVSRVVAQIAISTLVQCAIAGFLAVRTEHWGLLLIGVVAGLIGFQYSLPPLHLKSAGIWQLPSLQLDLVFLPGLFVLYAYDHPLDWDRVATVAGFALVLVSLFVTSHAEDYIEDRQLGFHTYTVAMGLTRTMYVQSSMLFVGSVVLIGSVVTEFGFTWWLLLYVAAWAVSQRFLFTVIQDVRGVRLEDALEKLHRKSLIGPYHAAVMGWATLVLAVALLSGR